MSTYRPKNSPYFHFDFVWKGQRVFGTTGCTSKRDADRFEAEERRKVILGEKTKPIITVNDACGLYQEHAEDLPSWPTIDYMLAALVSGLGGNRALGDVTQRELQVYFATRRHNRTNATINREIENTRAVWLRANAARFDVGEMPDWGKLFLKVPKTAPRELKLSEEDALFDAVRDDLMPAIEFLYLSGWRRGEVIGLRWSDCDLNTMQAETRLKGGEVVKRPLTASLVAIIANQPKVGPFVFTYLCQQSRGKRRKGQRYPMTPTVLRLARIAWRRAGVEGFRIHDLRHTRMTRIVRNTGSLAAAKEAGKHKSMATTLRYAHVLDQDVRNALDASESRTIPETGIPASAKG